MVSVYVCGAIIESGLHLQEWLFYVIFSGEVHLRVQEHEGIGKGSFVSPSHVTFVTPAHLKLCLLAVLVWGVLFCLCSLFAFQVSCRWLLFD